MKTKFEQGPKVSIEIETAHGKIISSRLSLSDSFSCIGAEGDLLEWIHAYSQKSNHPFPLSLGTSFQETVMRAMLQIPFGKTVSYTELARLSGYPQAARAAGTACGRNPLPFFVPCHRVIRLDGGRGGFSGGLEIKRRLLKFEAGDHPASSM